MDRNTRFDWVYLLLLMAVALVLRLDFLIPVNFVVDADEAIVGLMAKHISEGGPIPTFYYGQHYMGSLEPLLVAFCFKAFGTSAISLKIVPLIFSLGLIVVVYLIGREVGNAWTARSAALFTAIPASSLVVWSGKSRGGFIEILFLGACAMLLAIRWLKQSDPKLFSTFVIGFVLGFGWWTNNQIIFFMLPIGLFMLGRLLWCRSARGLSKARKILAHALLGIVAFLVGGAPFWIYNINHEFVSFEMFGSAEKGDLFKHVSGLFSTSLPIILGAKRFWDYEDLFPSASLIAFSLFGTLFLVVIWHRLKDLVRLFTLKVSENEQVEILLVFVVTTMAVFTLSSFGYLIQAPRYLLPLYIGVYVLCGKGIEYLARGSRAIAFGYIFSIVGFNLASCYVHGRAIPGEPFVFKQQRVERDHSSLIAWLDSHSITYVRTNYWIGYRLAFETGERVKFSVFQEPPQVRIKSYELEAEAEGREHMPLVLVPAQSPLVEQGLSAFGISYMAEDVGGYRVLYDLKTHEHPYKPIPKDRMQASSSSNSGEAANAIDNNLETRWGTGAPQKPGQEFAVSLKEPIELVGFRYHLGKWFHDYPRKLRIEVISPDGTKKTILDDAASEGVRYLSYGNPEWGVYFDAIPVQKVVLTQMGNEGFFDWSIGEVDLLQNSSNGG